MRPKTTQKATYLLYILLMALSMPVHSENIVSLDDAVNKYVYNTRYVKTQRLVLENALLEYDNFKKND